MRSSGLMLVFVFLLSCSQTEQEKKNPLAGTTWEQTSGKWAREDTTLTFPNSPFDHTIMIFGSTHYNMVGQDTSRNFFEILSATYTIDGDNFTFTIQMSPDYKAIEKSVNLKFKINGDQLVFNAAGLKAYGYEWKEWHGVWKRID